MTRPYESIQKTYATAHDVASKAADFNRERQIRSFIDILWDHLASTGVSWAGFYLPDGEGGLVLGPSRDKPACSPIGMHGACGRAFLEKRPLVVRDVADLGENYVACDPRDRSEMVVPLLESSGDCWGVLDLDSFEVGAFDQSDVDGLRKLLQKCGLTAAETL